MQIHRAHLAYYASHRAICMYIYIYIQTRYTYLGPMSQRLFVFLAASPSCCTRIVLARRVFLPIFVAISLYLCLSLSLSLTRWMPSRRTINQINQVATCHSLVLSISKLITSFNEDKRFVCSCLSLNSSSSSSTIYHAPSPSLSLYLPCLSDFVLFRCLHSIFILFFASICLECTK